VPFDLDPVQIRVLGALLEKDLATPDYYPLSLNALVNACNQKSNREPVVSYDPPSVLAALERLREARLVAFVSEAGSRVEKYRHRLSELMNLTRGELAVLAVLLLRGAQTGGELKQRASSMHPFEDLQAVESALARLAARVAGPLALQLPRAAGEREPRWAHLLSGEPQAPAPEPAPPAEPGLRERVARLESELAATREDLHLLRQDFDTLRRSLL
jgi:uncharacterized protein YceH (UPF0502 family)